MNASTTRLPRDRPAARGRHQREEHSVRDHPHRNQRLRPHRPPDPEGHARATSRRARGRCRQRPGRRRDERPPVQVRLDATAALPGRSRAGDNAIVVDGHEIRSFSERDPAALPWGDLGVDIVVESTGIFTDATKASAHRDAGAKKVIIIARRPRTRTSRSSSASTRTDTTRRSTTSSATPAARRTGSPCRPR